MRGQEKKNLRMHKPEYQGIQLFLQAFPQLILLDHKLTEKEITFFHKIYILTDSLYTSLIMHIGILLQTE